jgi:WD40 repeat protein
MRTFKAHTKLILALAFSPDGKQLATSSGDSTVRLWNLEGPSEIKEYPGTIVESPLAFSPDGRYFAQCDEDGVAVHDLKTQTCILTTEFSPQNIAFAPDGKEIAAFGADNPFERWALPKVKELSGGWGGDRDDNDNERFPTGAMAYSPDGKTIALCYGVDSGKGFAPHLLLWDRKSGKQRGELVMDFRFAYPSVIAYSPDGSVIAGNYGPVLGVIDVKSGKQVATIKPGKKHFKGFAFTPDGKRLIAVNTDAVVRVYDTTTWKETTGFEWKIGKLTSVAVAPDGLRAACGSHLGRVMVWDLDD